MSTPLNPQAQKAITTTVERDAFLSAAADHADFERRIEAWDERERRLRAMDPVL